MSNQIFGIYRNCMRKLMLRFSDRSKRKDMQYSYEKSMIIFSDNFNELCTDDSI